MKKKINYYSIHDILKLKTNIELPIPDFFLIKDERVESSFSPDIEIIRENLDIAKTAGKVAKGRNFFYWTSGPELIIDYAVPFMNTKLIINLKGNIKVKFTKSLDRFGRVELPSINSILDIKLTQKNFALLHSGCLNYNGECLLFVAPRDVGKTSAILSLLDGKNTKFMSDDLTIISKKGEAYAYPEKVGISPYTLTGNLIPPYGGKGFIKRRLARHHFLLLLLGRFFNSELVERKEVPRNLIKNKGRIEKIFILKGGVGREKIEEMEHEEGFKRIISATLGLINPLKVYLLNFYSYICDFSLYDHLLKKEKIIKEAIKDAKCFEVRSNNSERYPRIIKGIMRD